MCVLAYGGPDVDVTVVYFVHAGANWIYVRDEAGVGDVGEIRVC